MMLKIMLILFFIIMTTGLVYSAGMHNDFLGLRATGMGNIFTGVADDCSAIYWNPAGLTQITAEKIDYDFEINALTFPKYTYSSASDGKDYSTTKSFYAPSLFGAMNMGKLAFGAGIYAAYGMGTVLLDDVPMFGDLVASIGLYVFGASVAYEVNSKLLIGFTGETAFGKLDMSMSRAYQGAYYVEYEQKMFGYNTGYRGALGVVYKPVSDMKIGLVVKSPTTLEFEGDLNITVVDSPGPPTAPPVGTKLVEDDSATYTTQIPWYFLTGVSYKVMPNTLIAVDYAYRMWSDVKYKTTEYEDTSGNSGKDNSETKYKDNWTVGLGAIQEITPEIKATAGISYTTHAREPKYYNAATGADLSFYNMTVGAGYKISESIEIILNLYYYRSTKEEDMNGNKYFKRVYGQIIGVRGAF